jgi:hypothetical protein
MVQCGQNTFVLGEKLEAEALINICISLAVEGNKLLLSSAFCCSKFV